MKRKPIVTLMMTLWGRPEVFRVVRNVLNRFMDHPDVVTTIVFVISKEDPFYEQLLSIIKGSAFEYKVVHYSNDKLGAKHTAGIKEALKTGCDYVMNIGSDDLLHSALWNLYLPYMLDGYHIIGLRKLYFYAPPGDAILFSYNSGNLVVGAGRLMHAGMLKKIWKTPKKLYDDECQRGLDTNSSNRMCSEHVMPLILDAGQFPMIVDIKTKDNINEMDRIRSTHHFNTIQDVSSSLLLCWFPELKTLCHES